MLHLGKKNPTLGVSRRLDLSDRIVAYLRRRYPQKWAEQAAADLGISKKTIQKLEERGGAPSLALFEIMGDAYGPEFVCEVMPSWQWLSPKSYMAKQETLEADLESLKNNIEQILASR